MLRAVLLGVWLAAWPAAAQETIEWSPDRKLLRTDFKGQAPAGATTTSLSWINIETSWECEGGELKASARAAFDPSRSWWRRSARTGLAGDSQLLEHEQLHFDIAEAAARRIRAGFASFKDACLDPGGLEQIRRMVLDADRDLQEEQGRYDRETRHGTNPAAQDRWKRRIAPLLR